jgi:hypothetical protein
MDGGCICCDPICDLVFSCHRRRCECSGGSDQSQRTIVFGFGSAMITLVILCILVFVSSVGVAGWEAVVYKSDGSRQTRHFPGVRADRR